MQRFTIMSNAKLNIYFNLRKGFHIFFLKKTQNVIIRKSEPVYHYFYVILHLMEF